MNDTTREQFYDGVLAVVRRTLILSSGDTGALPTTTFDKAQAIAARRRPATLPPFCSPMPPFSPSAAALGPSSAVSGNDVRPCAWMGTVCPSAPAYHLVCGAPSVAARRAPRVWR